jgi:membrane associated rhomboid family serine protease
MKPFDRRFLFNLLFPTLFVALLWIILWAQVAFKLDLHAFGIYPRSVEGLLGIITAPLVHGSYMHLLSNSIPLIVLGTIMFYFYHQIAFRIFFWVYFMTDLWVWAGARGGNAYHIGASGLIYGFVSFLFFSGIFRKDNNLLKISLVVLIFYNGLVWGVFPIDESVSWESHLLGSLAGIICAWFFRSEGPKREQYSWETEPEDPEDHGDEEEEGEEETGENGFQELPPPTVHYHFKPTPKSPSREDNGKP